MKATCLHHPDRPHYARGLCQRCFNYAYLQIRIGRWTWEQLESQGKAAPKRKPGSPAPDWAKDIAG